MSYRAWFQCINPQCGATYPLNSIVYQCRKCQSLLEVQHDTEALTGLDAQSWKALFEQRYVTHVLAQHGGNVTKAAEASGVGRRYFQTVRSRSKE